MSQPESKVKVLVTQSCPALCDPMDCSPLCPWNSPGKNTGVGSHFLLQEIFLTQGLYPVLLEYRKILYHLSHQGICKFKSNMNCFTKYSSTALKNCQKSILIQNYFQSHELEHEQKQENGHSALLSY